MKYSSQSYCKISKQNNDYVMGKLIVNYKNIFSLPIYMIIKFIKNVLSMIVIVLPLPFIVLLDIFVEIYNQTCFPFYGIPKVQRNQYIAIWDRSHLMYLSFFGKMGCMYCWYTNGFAAYLKEIANRTEAYRCAIKHADKLKWQEHQTKKDFVPFGNKLTSKENKKKIKKIKQKI